MSNEVYHHNVKSAVVAEAYYCIMWLHRSYERPILIILCIHKHILAFQQAPNAERRKEIFPHTLFAQA